MKKLVFFSVLLLFVPERGFSEQFFVCKDKDGKITMGNIACPENETAKKVTMPERGGSSSSLSADSIRPDISEADLVDYLCSYLSRKYLPPDVEEQQLHSIAEEYSKDIKRVTTRGELNMMSKYLKCYKQAGYQLKEKKKASETETLLASAANKKVVRLAQELREDLSVRKMRDRIITINDFIAKNYPDFKYDTKFALDGLKKSLQSRSNFFSSGKSSIALAFSICYSGGYCDTESLKEDAREANNKREVTKEVTQHKEDIWDDEETETYPNQRLDVQTGHMMNHLGGGRYSDPVDQKTFWCPPGSAVCQEQ